MSDWLADAEKGTAPGSKQDLGDIKSGVGGETAQGAAEGVVSAIPGGEYVVNKIAHAIDPKVSPEQLQEAGERIQSRAPTAYAAGNLAGNVAGGAALPAGGAGLLTKVATQAAIGAALTPAYKFGETANQALLQNTPISNEQLRQVFSLDDILQSAGLSALGAGVLHGLGSTPSLVSSASAKVAANEGERLFEKVAPKTGRSAESLAQRALDEGLLRDGAIDAKLAEASARLDTSKVEITPDAGKLVATSMAARLADHSQQYEQFSPLAGARKYVDRVAKSLQSKNATWGGEELHELMNQVSSKSRTLKDNSQRAFLQDAVQIMRDEYGTSLELLNPEAGSAWRSAMSDYKVYVNMQRANKSMPQITAKDIGKTAAVSGIGAASVAAGNPAIWAAEGAAAVLGGERLRGAVVPRGRNIANLADKFSKMTAPGSTFETRVRKSLDLIMKGGTDWISQLPAKDLHKRYEELSNAFQSAAADSTGAAEKLRGELDFLPSQQADAATAAFMDQLQTHAVETQTQTGVTTAFGVHTVKTDREKRTFLRHVEAAHDPFYAVASGSPDLVQVAAKNHPETVKELQKRVMAEVSADQNMPYSKKRRISAILGVAGTATQDPLLGSILQARIKDNRQQQTAQGQAESARTKAAGVAKDLESATRVQNLMKLGTGDK